MSNGLLQEAIITQTSRCITAIIVKEEKKTYTIFKGFEILAAMFAMLHVCDCRGQKALASVLDSEPTFCLTDWPTCK